MPKYINLKGQIFGRLTVLQYIGIKWDCANWLCGCRCGWYTECTIADLRRKSKPKRSCGKCYADHRWPSEWLAWRNMQIRCYSETSEDYKNYGARGITVAKEWREDFFNFLEYMGLKEDPKLTLERLDVNGNYEPGNCVWADRYTQCHNRTISRANTIGT